MSNSLRPHATVTYLASPSMGFSRQEYWSGLPFPSLGIFPTQGSNPSLLPCRQLLYHLSHQRSPSGAQCKIKMGAPYSGGFSFSDYRALNQACTLLLRAWSSGFHTAGRSASPNSFSAHPSISSLYTRTHSPSTPHPTSLTPQLCPQKRGIDIFPEKNLNTCANYKAPLQNHCRW